MLKSRPGVDTATTTMSSGEIEMGLEQELDLELNPLTMSSGETEMGLGLKP